MSSNKTANLQLNQWQAGDAFLREEFNQDNGKIDAAVQGAKDANCMVKLMDITTTADAQQIDLDISKIRWERYTEVIVYATFVGKPSSGGGALRFNNLAGSSDYHLVHNGSYTATNRAAHLYVAGGGSNATNKYTIYCMSGEHTLFSDFVSGCTGGHGIGGNQTTALRALPLQKTMNFLPQENQTLTAGGKILVYGVLR